MLRLLYNKSKVLKFYFSLFYILHSQEPFLEIRPYAAPSYEQYPISAQLDHQLPTSNIADDVFLRFDGYTFGGNVIYPHCLNGISCYDGHAGVDFHMPFDTPILAPANGYVIWASFTDPADPCPGGIEPNGDQGTIILAHGNDYFSVYLHMNPPLNVSVGENVLTGDTLGFNGNSGCAVDAHLHFEIRKGNWYFNSTDPWAIDPYGWWGSFTDPIEQVRDNRSDWLWISSDLIDDGDNGFQRYQGPNWSYFNFGYDNDSWSAPATTSANDSRHFSIWVPYLENSGIYDVEVFIPDGPDATNGAIYEVIVRNIDNTNSIQSIVLDQTVNVNNFNNLTTLELPSGSNCSIILRDVVEQGSSGENVYFDAVRFLNAETSSSLQDTIKGQDNLTMFPLYPNPFNPSISFQYQINLESNIFIKIYNSNGVLVDSFVKEDQLVGNHHFKWTAKNSNGKTLPSGLYFITISDEIKTDVKKALLIH